MRLTWHHWLIFAVLTGGVFWLREHRPRFGPEWLFWPIVVLICGGAIGLAKLDLRAVTRSLNWKKILVWCATIAVIGGSGIAAVHFSAGMKERQKREAEALALEMTPPFEWWRWPDAGGKRQLILESVCQGKEVFLRDIEEWENVGILTDLQARDMRLDFQLLTDGADRDSAETKAAYEARRLDYFLLRMWAPSSKESARNGMEERLYWVTQSGLDWRLRTSWAAAETATESEWKKYDWVVLPIAESKKWREKTFPSIIREIRETHLVARERREAVHEQWKSKWSELSPEDHKALRACSSKNGLTLAYVKQLVAGTLSVADLLAKSPDSKVSEPSP